MNVSMVRYFTTYPKHIDTSVFCIIFSKTLDVGVHQFKDNQDSQKNIVIFNLKIVNKLFKYFTCFGAICCDLSEMN